jgi:starvation-inducible DNA-binding protein
LHKLFDELADSLEDYVDDIAERAVEMGGYALGTNRMSAANSRLPEYPTDAVDGMEHVQALAERYALAAKHTRAAINVPDGAGDKDTADLFTDLSRGMDKWLWFLEAHRQS